MFFFLHELSLPYQPFFLLFVLRSILLSFNRNMSHIGYRGIDIKLDYIIENDRYTTRCDTYTNGSYELFSLIGLTVPSLEMPSGRL